VETIDRRERITRVNVVRIAGQRTIFVSLFGGPRTFVSVEGVPVPSVPRPCVPRMATLPRKKLSPNRANGYGARRSRSRAVGRSVGRPGRFPVHTNQFRHGRSAIRCAVVVRVYVRARALSAFAVPPSVPSRYPTTPGPVRKSRVRCPPSISISSRRRRHEENRPTRPDPDVRPPPLDVPRGNTVSALFVYRKAYRNGRMSHRLREISDARNAPPAVPIRFRHLAKSEFAISHEFLPPT